MRIGYPICLILMVSSMPVYRSCASTHGMSNRMGDLSVFGFMQRTNQGLHRDMDSSNCWRLSENLWTICKCKRKNVSLSSSTVWKSLYRQQYYQTYFYRLAIVWALLHSFLNGKGVAGDSTDTWNLSTICVDLFLFPSRNVGISAFRFEVNGASDSTGIWD